MDTGDIGLLFYVVNSPWGILFLHLNEIKIKITEISWVFVSVMQEEITQGRIIKGLTYVN